MKTRWAWRSCCSLLVSWVGHAAGGFAEFAADQVRQGLAWLALTDYLATATFWFESFENWQRASSW